MDSRRRFRLYAGLLTALIAVTCPTGCETLRAWRPNPGAGTISSPTSANPNPAALSPAGAAISASGGVGGGGANGAGAGQILGPDGTPLPPVAQIAGAGDPPQPTAQPLPAPRPLNPGSTTATTPPAPNGYPRAAGQGNPMAGADLHRRQTPTVTGSALELAPWEMPADRVVELAKQLEYAMAENHTLVARIKQLEEAGKGREQALVEAVREFENLTAEAARNRALLQSEISRLQERNRKLEADDIEFLQAVLRALRRLFPEDK